MSAMKSSDLQLNRRAARLCQTLIASADEFQVKTTRSAAGTLLIDCGIEVAGSEAAAVLLARICLADLGEVAVNRNELSRWPLVEVSTEEPVAACMAAQYAGWEVEGGDYFAMGSGPMRAAAAREPLLASIGFQEQANECVGVLEASNLPPEEVCRDIAGKCGITPERLTLLVAPTRSLAGTLQIVARSVETTLHKLHELGFDLGRIIRGCGAAPLPPLVDDDFAAIGTTNDAILYGADVKLEVHGDDQTLQELGPSVPSSSSKDYGRPFGEILANFNNDFYQVDPLLFSPARVQLVNVESSNSWTYGEINNQVLEQSFRGGEK